MVNVNNYGNRGAPSVLWGRQNIAARYENHAMMRRNGSLFNCWSSIVILEISVFFLNLAVLCHLVDLTLEVFRLLADGVIIILL